MNKGLLLLGGVGIGAGFMYMFDPDRGARRRARVRDKFQHAANKVNDYAGKVSRDLRNWDQGLVAETATAFEDDAVRDDVLVERVRAAMGRIPANRNALKATAVKGIVTLSGEAQSNELPALMLAIRQVPGVKDIVSELKVHEETSETSSLHERLRQVAG